MKQPHYNEKKKASKIIAILAALGIVTGGAGVTAKMVNSNDKNDPVTTSNVDVTNANEIDYANLLLIANELSEINKKYSKDDYMNCFYYYLGDYAKLEEYFQKHNITDANEKYKLIVKWANLLVGAASVNVDYYSRRLKLLVSDFKKLNDIPSSLFEFYPTDLLNSDLSVELNSIIKTQKANIKNNDKETIKECNDMFNKFLKKLEKLEDEREKVILYSFVHANESLFEEKDLKNLRTKAGEVYMADVLAEMNLTNEINWSKLKKDSDVCGKDKSKEGYITLDEKEAKERLTPSERKGKTEVKKGGKHVASGTSKSSLTTKIHTSEFTANTKNTTGSYTKVVEGGDVVDEKTTQTGGEEISKEDKEPITTNDDIPVMVDDEYNEAKENVITTTKKTTTTNQNTSTTKYYEITYVDDDIEDIPVMDEDEFNEANKSALGIGVGASALAGSVYAFKRRKK